VDETDRVRRLYDGIAERYDRSEGAERRVFGSDVRRLARDARGEVLELAIGTGRTLPEYGADVRLTGLDLSPGMLAVARRRASALGRTVELVEGDAQALPFADASFDTVLSVFSLCTVPDVPRVLAEARRVLRPGGQLLLTEHVRSPNALVRGVQHVAEPVMWRCFCDHLLRDPLDHLAAAGYEATVVERSRLGLLERVAARPRIA
jgi:ubiquinone/menaquinone biosynthesis C-methylase UbiE